MEPEKWLDCEFLKAESAGFLTGSHLSCLIAVTPGDGVWRVSVFPSCCHRPDPPGRGGRHWLVGLLGPGGRHLIRTSIPLTASIAAKQERGVPGALGPLPTTPCLDRSEEATGYGEGAHTPAKIDAF